MRRGRLGDIEGPDAAGPDDFMRLSLTGDAEMGPGGGPASRWAKDPPPGGGRDRRIEPTSDQRDLPAWAAETGKDAQM
jgi:hypothetical protein